MDWEWWGDPVMVCSYLTMLLMCSSHGTRWRGVGIAPGEFVTSRSLLAKRIGITERQVRTVISRLEETGEISVRSSSQYSIIKVTNWADYQCSPSDEVRSENDQRNDQDNDLSQNDLEQSAVGERPANDQRTTSERPASGTKNDQRNDQDNDLSQNDLEQSAVGERPANDQRTTSDTRENRPHSRSKEIRKKISPYGDTKERAKITFGYETDAKIHGITPEQLELWRESFPAISVELELKSASAWLDANRRNRKYDIKRFLVNWLKRSQDRAARVTVSNDRERHPDILYENTCFSGNERGLKND